MIFKTFLPTLIAGFIVWGLTDQVNLKIGLYDSNENDLLVALQKKNSDEGSLINQSTGALYYEMENDQENGYIRASNEMA